MFFFVNYNRSIYFIYYLSELGRPMMSSLYCFWYSCYTFALFSCRSQFKPPSTRLRLFVEVPYPDSGEIRIYEDLLHFFYLLIVFCILDSQIPEFYMYILSALVLSSSWLWWYQVWVGDLVSVCYFCYIWVCNVFYIKLHIYALSVVLGYIIPSSAYC